MHSTIPAAKRRRSRHVRSAGLLALYGIAITLIAFALFDFVAS